MIVMKLVFSVLLLSIVPIEAYSKNLSTYKINKLIQNYSKDKLKNNLYEFLKFTSPSRMVGTKGHKKAREWIINEINKLDVKKTGKLKIESFNPKIKTAISMYQGDFNKNIKSNYKPSDKDYKKWKRFLDSIVSNLNRLKKFKGKNIIWEKRGITHPHKILVIGANYDSLSFKDNIIDRQASMQGADNNGSGVSIAMSLIDIISKLKVKKTIRIIFFDFEELGALGSYDYVNRHKKKLKKIEGFINLKMLGNDTINADKKKKSGNMKIYVRNGNSSDLKLAKKMQNTHYALSGVKFTIDSNDLFYSDHVRFWDANIAAIAFSQNWEDDYNNKNHTSDDIIQRINFRTLYNCLKYIAKSTIIWLVNS